MLISCNRFYNIFRAQFVLNAKTLSRPGDWIKGKGKLKGNVVLCRKSKKGTI